MRKINTSEDLGYKYIIGLTPQEARVLKTSLEYLPQHAKNTQEIQSILDAVDDVATVENTSIYGDDNPTCTVCE